MSKHSDDAKWAKQDYEDEKHDDAGKWWEKISEDAKWSKDEEDDAKWGKHGSLMKVDDKKDENAKSGKHGSWNQHVDDKKDDDAKWGKHGWWLKHVEDFQDDDAKWGEHGSWMKVDDRKDDDAKSGKHGSLMKHVDDMNDDVTDDDTWGKWGKHVDDSMTTPIQPAYNIEHCVVTETEYKDDNIRKVVRTERTRHMNDFASEIYRANRHMLDQVMQTSSTEPQIKLLKMRGTAAVETCGSSSKEKVSPRQPCWPPPLKMLLHFPTTTKRQL